MKVDEIVMCVSLKRFSFQCAHYGELKIPDYRGNLVFRRCHQFLIKTERCHLVFYSVIHLATA